MNATYMPTLQHQLLPRRIRLTTRHADHPSTSQEGGSLDVLTLSEPDLDGVGIELSSLQWPEFKMPARAIVRAIDRDSRIRRRIQLQNGRVGRGILRASGSRVLKHEAGQSQADRRTHDSRSPASL